MSHDQELPLEVSRKIDALCLQFEQRWQANDTPSIEAFLDRWNDSDVYLAQLFQELLLIELDARRESQGTFVISHYADRFPNYQEAIEKVFGEISDSQMTLDLSPQTGDEKPDQEVPLPQEIGRYQINCKLGEGSYGVVYLAYDPELDCKVAIKELKIDRILSDSPEQFDEAQVIQNLLREARLAARLRKYEGIVAVLDVLTFSENNSIQAIYCVQEFIDGGDLKHRLQSAPVSPAETARILKLVSQAMGNVHEQGIYHRDLKPANIILDLQGVPYVTDFGLAIDARLQQQSRGEIAGTLEYMSPEQIRGEVHLFDGRTDIWSLGVIMYEMLTLKRPFNAAGLTDAMQEICHKQPVSPRSHSPHLPYELERICLKCLSKRMTDRYASAQELSADLGAWLQSTDAGEMLSSAERLISDKVIPKGLRSFDQEDADFFPQLLPGPRDRYGLPESLSFWKRRIEEKDPDQTFRIGVLYGPSGSGKSSFLKAGLLPRLNQVVSVFVESTANDTEARLVRQLRKAAPQLPPDLSLPEVIVALRESPQLTAFKKIVIILDQFEQWLQSRRAYGREQLIEALRHCDGRRLQTFILIRDDFWMAITRFMQELEVDLVPGENIAAVDLFPPDHARKVLTEFGRGYGKIDEETGPTSKQQQFLDKTISGLTIDGKIVCVRLAIFAEMVKGKDWIPETIDAVGGTSGIGERFLEDSFSSGTSSPSHRRHAQAARDVLQCLLPEVGANIKGYMKSREELVSASGYEATSNEFAELINILDGELRLITPTDPDGVPQEFDEGTDTNYYQLTHDYLVHPLRDWLTRNQRSTRQGRARLLLSELAETWNTKPDPRNLPSPMEWLSIVRWTRRADRTDTQQSMVSASTRRLVRNSIITVATLFLLVSAAYYWNGHSQAVAAVSGLMNAETSELPNVITAIEDYAFWTSNDISRELKKLGDEESWTPEDRDSNTRTRINLELADAVLDPHHAHAVFDHLSDVPVEHLIVISQLLKPQAALHSDKLWERYQQAQAEEGDLSLRLAAIQAGLSPATTRWQSESKKLVDRILTHGSGDAAYWRDLFRPISEFLAPTLVEQLSIKQELSSERRTMLLDLITNYASEDAELLVKAIEFADSEELGPLLDELRRYPTDGLKHVRARLKALEPKPIVIDSRQILNHDEELMQRIEAAEGLVAQDGVMVQRVHRRDFDALDDDLEKHGFTANCVRPYFDGEEMYVAAVWVRADDPKHVNSEIFWGMSLADVKKQQAKLEQKYFIPVDFARYQPPTTGRERQETTAVDSGTEFLVPLRAPKPAAANDRTKWVVVWRPAGEDAAEKVQFYADLPLQEFRSREVEWQNQIRLIDRFEVWPDSWGELHCTLLQSQGTEFDLSTYADWRYARTFGDLSPSRLLTDLRLRSLSPHDRDRLGVMKYLIEAEHIANTTSSTQERDDKKLASSKYHMILGNHADARSHLVDLYPRWHSKSSKIHEYLGMLYTRTDNAEKLPLATNTYAKFGSADPAIVAYLTLRNTLFTGDSVTRTAQLQVLQNLKPQSATAKEMLARYFAVLATDENESKNDYINQSIDLLQDLIGDHEVQLPESVVFDTDFDTLRQSAEFQQLIRSSGLHQRYIYSSQSSNEFESVLFWNEEQSQHLMHSSEKSEEGFQPRVLTIQPDHISGTFRCASIWWKKVTPIREQTELARKKSSLILAAVRLGSEHDLRIALADSDHPDIVSNLVLYAPRVLPVNTFRNWLKTSSGRERQSVVLMLGAVPHNRIPSKDRTSLVSEITRAWQSSDSGVRSAANWCLRRWGEPVPVISATPDRDTVEISNPVGGRMIPLSPPERFLMGSRGWDSESQEQETRHWASIPRRYALAARETTVADFSKFLADPKVRDYYGDSITKFNLTTKIRNGESNLPITGVTWRDAAVYCQWLTEQDRDILEKDYCFPDIWNADSNQLPENYLSRTGYRLPTETEWEWAVRGGTTDFRRFVGDDDRQLVGYAWYGANSRMRLHECEQLRPNQFGFSDLLGNVSEWCDDLHNPYGRPIEGYVTVDYKGNKHLPQETEWCVLRGGNSLEAPEELRSANRTFQLAKYYSGFVGFRVCRTIRNLSSPD